MPDHLYLGNYEAVLQGNFFRYFGNSLFVLVVSLALLLFITACASYPLARFKLKICSPLYALIVACICLLYTSRCV